MAYCKKCGAYIPIEETTCPACGYDPEAEARAEKEAKERAEREARRREQEQSWAAQERKREEEARRWEEQRRRMNRGYGGSATQSQSASQNQGNTWVPPWSQGQSGSQNSYRQKTFHNSGNYSNMQHKAQDSVDNQKLSILSYLGLLFLVPLILRKDDPFARFHSNQGLVLFLANAILGTLIGWPLRGLLFAFDIFCVVTGINNVLQGKMEPLPLIGSIRLLK